MMENINFEEFIDGAVIHTNDLVSKSISSEVSNKFGHFEYNCKLLDGLYITQRKSFTNENISMLVDYSSESVLCFDFTLDGTMHYNTCDNSITQEQGTNTIWAIRNPHKGALMLKKNEPLHNFGVSISEKYLVSLVERYPNALTDFYNRYIKGEILVKKRNTTCEINRIISQIQNSYLLGNYSEMYIHSKITELLTLYLNDVDNDRMIYECNKCCKTNRDIDRIYEARQILLSSINCPPSIIDLSHKVGINDYKLKKGFKEIFNQTVYGCLFEHKMELAHNLLCKTEKSINAIASECGYEYVSHFSNAFKRKFGMSPLAYRQKTAG